MMKVGSLLTVDQVQFFQSSGGRTEPGRHGEHSDGDEQLHRPAGLRLLQLHQKGEHTISFAIGTFGRPQSSLSCDELTELDNDSFLTSLETISVMDRFAWD